MAMRDSEEAYDLTPESATLKKTIPWYQTSIFYMGILVLVFGVGTIVSVAIYGIMTAGLGGTPTMNLQIISRADWSAQTPSQKSNPLHHPVPYVVILQTSSGLCSTQAECSPLVLETQNSHIQTKRSSDIAFSFLVGGDGNVYEGRGWDTEWDFTPGYNDRSIGIAFIGRFTRDAPTDQQVQTGQQLIAKGVELGKISTEYKLLGQRQISEEQNPGSALYEVIKKWPHWVENP